MLTIPAEDQNVLKHSFQDVVDCIRNQPGHGRVRGVIVKLKGQPGHTEVSMGRMSHTGAYEPYYSKSGGEPWLLLQDSALLTSLTELHRTFCETNEGNKHTLFFRFSYSKTKGQTLSVFSASNMDSLSKVNIID